MSLDYDRFDPAACGFPRPRVPVLAPLTPAQLGAPRPAPATPRRHYARGRYALQAAYTLAGVGRGGALLAPAYHCRTMLDGALALGAEVVPYPLTPELHPDLDGLRRAAAACRTRPAAVLATHYFGLPRDIAALAAWCRDEGLALVEDCSHALVEADPGAPGRAPLGATGRWAVSSPYKFFPCPDGGWLWANGGAPLPAPPRAAGLADEARGLRQAWAQWRRPPVAPDAAALEAAFAALAPGEPGRDWLEHDGGTSADYRGADAGRAGLRVSRWIERRSVLESLVQARRRHYAQWVDALAGLPGLRPLLPALPAHVAPYMVPVLVDEPAALFPPLKRLGLPIWRWDDMAVSGCEVSRRYRQGLFHLPCHQALDAAAMAWMTGAVRRAARRPPP
ncbi:DegT/DnrJ/EryC1/StrS family aminotransferase [Rubrivivax sp. JA1026]|uniref:DegT/DnrJ/EryC1/StrS family aminotransferase n=1 Tax=Rubrivivax sp. JA1026 TaxID=2710888 RepID=UPI0013E9909C|nr:DegT/DnrJ/EryC1/StrS family aminotransferase [Rubrivivax sp. JA1026]